MATTRHPYLFEEHDNQPIEDKELRVDLDGYGFCWLRLRRRTLSG